MLLCSIFSGIHYRIVCVSFVESQWIGRNPQDKTEYAGRSEAVWERNAAGFVSSRLLHAIAQRSLQCHLVWLLWLTATRRDRFRCADLCKFTSTRVGLSSSVLQVFVDLSQHQCCHCSMMLLTTSTL